MPAVRLVLFRGLFQKHGQGGRTAAGFREQEVELDDYARLVDRMVEKGLGGGIPREEWVDLESSVCEWRFTARLLFQFCANHTGEFAAGVYEDLVVRLGRVIRHSKEKLANWQFVEENLVRLAESLLTASRDRAAERRVQGCGILLELLGPVSNEARDVITKIPPPLDFLEESTSRVCAARLGQHRKSTSPSPSVHPQRVSFAAPPPA